MSEIIIISDDDTWEPISNLECPDNIKEYERVKKEKKREKANKELKEEPKAKVSKIRYLGNGSL